MDRVAGVIALHEVNAMLFLKDRIGRIVQDLQRLTYPQSVDIGAFRCCKTGERYTDIAGLDSSAWDVFDTGSTWGGDYESFWFDTVVEIPPQMEGQCVIFEMTTGREGGWDATNPQFSFYLDGELRQGMDVNHRQVLLTEKAAAGESHRLTLAAYTGGRHRHLLLQARLRVVDRLTETFCYDLAVPLQVAELLGENDPAYRQIIQVLNESINLLDLRQEHSGEYYRTLALAQAHLTGQFYGKLCGRPAPVVNCVGHTHIDVAWLWTLAVTEDKAVRSFATVLRLMEEYPEYIFMSSQPQLYQYVQKNAPGLFEQIRTRVAEGRWEPEGSMFVEADCNIASGEALVRQILVGKRYFRREFGVDNKILWLPDVFGYSAALPQIMKKSGIDYFMTTKISWNEMNKLPYDTFEWIGIDGTAVLTHFITACDYKDQLAALDPKPSHFTTYNGYLKPSQVMGGWQRYQQKHLNDEVLMSFGYGDGGGGPTRDMLENQRRLAHGIPGAPATRPSTARRFFEDLAATAGADERLPAWSGELYLEYHRGTYTSMARNKNFNRRSEFALQCAEWLSAMNALLNGAGYPARQLDEAWEVLLRNQFHDILPGSSIKEVYDDSRREYEGLLGSAQAMIGRAAREIAVRAGQPGSLVVFNPNGFATPGVVRFRAADGQGQLRLLAGDEPVECQRMADGQWLALVPEIPAKGYRVFKATGSAAAPSPAPALADSGLLLSPDRLENRFFAIRLNDKGQFVSIYDKRAHRELVQSGQCANVLMSYEDKPHNHDAWDINHYYQEKCWPVDDVQSITVVESGPLCGCLQIQRKYLDSTIVQSVTIWRDIPRIDIRHEIDWKQSHVLLKLLIPVDIHSDMATFDIQYGNVQRPTHRNTSWDAAKFEVCMHKWLDLSEDNYGVSVLNDSKYGCSVHNGQIGITLLKSAIYPNPEADKEKHDFTISLLPHTGNWRQGGTVQQAYLLNNPMLAIRNEGTGINGGQNPLPQAMAMVGVDQENIVVEVVKMAEDGEGLVVRLYECYNRRQDVCVSFPKPIGRIAECDLMENEIAGLQPVVTGEHSGRAVMLSVKPYEIRTLKVTF